MKMLMTALALVPLAACATIPAAVREDGFARLGESTRAGAVVVRADGVAEDSRCPMNARCIWAGRVVLDATVTEGGVSQQRKLILGEPALVRSGSVTLDSVEPATQTNAPIRPADYRFHIRFDPR